MIAGDELAQQHSYNRKVLLYTYCVLTLILLTALSDVIRQFFFRSPTRRSEYVNDFRVTCTVYTLLVYRVTYYDSSNIMCRTMKEGLYIFSLWLAIAHVHLGIFYWSTELVISIAVRVIL